MDYPSFVNEDYRFITRESEEILKEVDRRVANRTVRKVHTKELKFDSGLVVDNNLYPFREMAFKCFLRVLGFSSSSACHVAHDNSDLFNSSMNRLLSDADRDLYIIIDADGNCIRGVSTNSDYYGEESFVRNVLRGAEEQKLVVVHGILSDPHTRISFANPESRVVVGDEAFDVSFDAYFQDSDFKVNFSTFITNIRCLGGMVVPAYPGVRKHFSLKSIKTLESFNKRVIHTSNTDYYARYFDKIEEALNVAPEFRAKELPDYAIYRRDAKRMLKPEWEGSKLSKEIGMTDTEKIKYDYNDEITIETFLNEIVEKAQVFEPNDPSKNYRCEKLAGKVLAHAEDFISKTG